MISEARFEVETVEEFLCVLDEIKTTGLSYFKDCPIDSNELKYVFVPLGDKPEIEHPNNCFSILDNCDKHEEILSRMKSRFSDFYLEFLKKGTSADIAFERAKDATKSYFLNRRKLDLDFQEFIVNNYNELSVNDA